MALKDWFVDLQMMDSVTKPDGYGGVIRTLAEGATFRGAITLLSNTEAKIAYQNGLKKIYEVTTTDLIQLKHNDVVKRVEDGLTVRITSDAKDKHTPPMSTQQYYVVTAEVMEL